MLLKCSCRVVVVVLLWCCCNICDVLILFLRLLFMMSFLFHFEETSFAYFSGKRRAVGKCSSPGREACKDATDGVQD